MPGVCSQTRLQMFSECSTNKNVILRTVEGGMTSRRSFLKCIGPAAIAVAMPPTLALATTGEDPCDLYARLLKEAMEKRHGGKWVISIDKKSIFGRRFG